MIIQDSAATASVRGVLDVRRRVAEAAQRAGRQADEITLVAVSKTFSAADIQPVIAAGQRAFGENRVQEARSKWPALRQQFSDLELHLIGPLQTNKVAEAVALFDVIQTVDRPKLAKALATEMLKHGCRRRVFIQVNTGREAQKAGVVPDEAASFIAYCRDELRLAVAGLMCIPPVDEAPEGHFALLRELASSQHLASLSMGMSGDFEAAIAAGASHIRVGSAIFGHRDYPA